MTSQDHFVIVPDEDLDAKYHADCSTHEFSWGGGNGGKANHLTRRYNAGTIAMFSSLSETQKTVTFKAGDYEILWENDVCCAVF